MSGSMASRTLTMYSSSSSAEPCTNWSRAVPRLDRALRQRTQPFQVGWRELIAGPERGQARHGIEFFEVHEAADGLVVIAAHKNAAQRLGAGDHLIGIAAVADRIAQVHDEVVRRSGGQTGFQRFEVAVNVAEKKDAHGRGGL